MSSILLATILGLSLFTQTEAHGQLSSITVGGQSYESWGLKAYWEVADVIDWTHDAAKTYYQRKTDNLNNGFSDIHNSTLATGGTIVPARMDPVSPVGVIKGNAGDAVQMQWYEWPTEGHTGIIGEWMAQCPDNSCQGVDGTTLDWFSIAQHSYDPTEPDFNKRWPTDKLGAEGLKWDFNLPDCLPTGAYLVRHELIALHNMSDYDNDVTHPQFYPTAFELDLTSDGSITSLPSGTQTGRFPGLYTQNSKIFNYNVFRNTGQDSQGNNIYDPEYLKTFRFPGGVKVLDCGVVTGLDNGPDEEKGEVKVIGGTAVASGSTGSSAVISGASSTRSGETVEVTSQTSVIMTAVAPTTAPGDSTDSATVAATEVSSTTIPSSAAATLSSSSTSFSALPTNSSDANKMTRTRTGGPGRTDLPGSQALVSATDASTAVSATITEGSGVPPKQAEGGPESNLPVSSDAQAGEVATESTTDDSGSTGPVQSGEAVTAPAQATRVPGRCGRKTGNGSPSRRSRVIRF